MRVGALVGPISSHDSQVVCLRNILPLRSLHGRLQKRRESLDFLRHETAISGTKYTEPTGFLRGPAAER